MKVMFKDYMCDIVLRKYENGRPAIYLMDSNDGMPVAIASVNLPEFDLGKDEVCIKDYSENEGMLRCLVRSGIVTEPLRVVQSGWVHIPVCRLVSGKLGGRK